MENNDYYKESEFNGEWIPMSKKEIMEYCDIQIQDNRMLKEENKKLFDDLEKETSYEKYCLQQIEKTGESPSIVDYIKFLEFRHDEEQETLSRAEERYKTHMKTLKENRELKKEIIKLKQNNSH